MKKIYFVGDMITSTGPAVVNKSYYPYLKQYSYYCFSNNKVIRIIHFLLHVFFIKSVVISGYSRLNSIIISISKKKKLRVSYLMHGFLKEELKYKSNCNSNKIISEEYLYLKNYDKIICVSKLLSDRVIESYPELKYKMFYVNNGADIENINFNNNITKNKNTIMSVGGGNAQKNNLAVCKALKSIDFKGIFIVVGPLGEDGLEIKKYDFVDYYESLDHTEVIKKMNESKIYIQNSYFETFGLSVVEALNSKCNLIISKNVGAISILKNINKNNIIYDNTDINEIGKKINYNFNHDCSVYFDENECSWKARSSELLSLIK